jgi:hypothetical protein
MPGPVLGAGVSGFNLNTLNAPDILGAYNSGKFIFKGSTNTIYFTTFTQSISIMPWTNIENSVYYILRSKTELIRTFIE